LEKKRNRSILRGMSIDGCTSTFAEMAATILPGDMRRLRSAEPVPLSSFCKTGQGITSILSQIGKNKDFSGCYVLRRPTEEPFYVGISRTVVQRLRQHVTGKTHFDASLAYLMAADRTALKMKRTDAMLDGNFRKAFDEAKDFLRACSVVFVEISNPLELYLFEAYCAMELDTSEWNTFRTH
jgi:hypothetical protein